MVADGAAKEYVKDGVPMLSFMETMVGTKEGNKDVAQTDKVMHACALHRLVKPSIQNTSKHIFRLVKSSIQNPSSPLYRSAKSSVQFGQVVCDSFQPLYRTSQNTVLNKQKHARYPGKGYHR